MFGRRFFKCFAVAVLAALSLLALARTDAFCEPKKFHGGLEDRLCAHAITNQLFVNTLLAAMDL